MNPRTPLCSLWDINMRKPRLETLLALTASMLLLAACVLAPIISLLCAENVSNIDLEGAVALGATMRDPGLLAPIYVEVNARGWAFVSGRRVSPPALREMVRRARRLLPEQHVIFKVAESASIEHLEPFLQACLNARIGHIQIKESGKAPLPQ